MAQQAIIVTPELLDQSSIYASSTFAAGMPAENVLDPQPRHVARSTDVNPAFMSFDMGLTYTVDFVAILFTSCGQTATWRARLGTAQDSWTEDSGTLDVHMNKAQRSYTNWNWVHSFHDFAANKSARYLRIDITETGASWIDIGRVYLGLKWQPPHNFAYGSSVPMHEEVPQIVEAEGGASYAIGRPNRLSGRFIFEHLSESALMDNLWEVNRLRGLSRDLLMIPFPESDYPMHTMTYGRLSQPTTTIIPEFSRYTMNLAIKEMT